MSGRYAHVVQVRLTQPEWRQIARLAQVRGITVEELLREALRLSPPAGRATSVRESHLRVVRSG